MKYLITIAMIILVGCASTPSERQILSKEFFACVERSESDIEVIQCKSFAPQPEKRFRPLGFANPEGGGKKYECDKSGLCWAVCANDTPESSCGGLLLACPANGPDACDAFCDGNPPDVCYCQCD